MAENSEDGIYQEASLNRMLTPEDFQAEFGRPRTEEEQAEYETFSHAARLADPETHVEWRDPE
jgi:hypothetical protein